MKKFILNIIIVYALIISGIEFLSHIINYCYHSVYHIGYRNSIFVGGILSAIIINILVVVFFTVYKINKSSYVLFIAFLAVLFKDYFILMVYYPKGLMLVSDTVYFYVVYILVSIVLFIVYKIVKSLKIELKLKYFLISLILVASLMYITYEYRVNHETYIKDRVELEKGRYNF